jgi:DivIVA domain-containing protein
VLPTDPRELVAATHFTRRVRGYDPEEVDAFLLLLLDMVAGPGDSTGELASPVGPPTSPGPPAEAGWTDHAPEPEVRSADPGLLESDFARPPLIPVAPAPDAVGDLAHEVAQVLAAADRQAQAMVAAARAQADRITAEARQEAAAAETERGRLADRVADGRAALQSVLDLIESAQAEIHSAPPPVERFTAPWRMADHPPVVMELPPVDPAPERWVAP